jgi:hypothetical protein
LPDCQPVAANLQPMARKPESILVKALSAALPQAPEKTLGL